MNFNVAAAGIHNNISSAAGGVSPDTDKMEIGLKQSLRIFTGYDASAPKFGM